jgi:hypothetical protein
LLEASVFCGIQAKTGPFPLGQLRKFQTDPLPAFLFLKASVMFRFFPKYRRIVAIARTQG